MVKCEKVKSGYIIEINGESNNVIGEIAYAASAYHVASMREIGVNMENKEKVKKAILASCELFELLMITTMEEMLGVEDHKNMIERLSSLLGKKDGAVQ